MSNYLVDGYHREAAAFAPESARVAFIKRTYGVLLICSFAFVGLEALLIKSGLGMQFMVAIVQNPLLLLLTIVAFIGSGFLARYLARSDAAPATQVLGLAIYVTFQALIFLPIMLYCMLKPGLQDVPMQAGILTLVVFGGLSAVVFVSKKDFSFLGKMLMVASFLALGVVIVAIFTGLSLGVWFAAAMIALACGYILYDTSNVLHHYPTNAHMAAALELFASLALLFYYIINLMVHLTGRD